MLANVTRSTSKAAPALVSILWNSYNFEINLK